MKSEDMIEGEDYGEYLERVANLIDRECPVGMIQVWLAIHLAGLLWRRARLGRLADEMAKDGKGAPALSRQLESLSRIERTLDGNIARMRRELSRPGTAAAPPPGRTLH